MAHITLILGGARSGKSRHGEEMALTSGLDPVYIATARAWDDEMLERIAAHQARRVGQGWLDVEAPLDLVTAINDKAAEGRVLLIDCLTLWLTNLMMAELKIDMAATDLHASLRAAPGRVILISNEVGFGIVPENAMARQFRDHAGRLHQDIARDADQVLLMVAGLPVVVKASA
ncbi:MAG: bifunctional adenosylcobinamide kinase/adenosylcobinamide-phosphate guanylyltransferase [Alphaproteobacteria bacterium]|jgi:adenosylcobinamide kinase / adenosylcobinamide-phosphate guanylyltransferase|nr:bifunctional adenosylcobinamide kinase/adenosylcobinamide-phosphate guanylyltransferase [Alphaproteobacteria bacterium]